MENKSMDNLRWKAASKKYDGALARAISQLKKAINTVHEAAMIAKREVDESEAQRLLHLHTKLDKVRSELES
jgi:enoyl reductase-like protein